MLLNIPLASLPAGRGTSPGYTVLLRYDSKLFDSVHTTRDDGDPDENNSSYFSIDTVTLSDRGGWKMPVGYQLQITDRRNLQTADVCHMHDPVEHLSFVWKVEMVMPDGSIRTFFPVAANGSFIGTGADGYSNVNYNGEELTAIQGTHPGSGICYTDVSSTGPVTTGMNYITMDGSRLRLFIPYSATVQPNLRNWKMYYPDGTVVERAPTNSSAWQTITDRNGNKIEFIDNKIQDSAGRYIEFASDSTGQIIRTKGVNGAVVETHIEWEDRWIQKKYRTTTASNAQSSQQYATFAASVPGVKKITFPTQAGGQTMEFEYYSNATQPGANVYTEEWGEIKSIKLPTGAESSFAFDQVGQGGYETLASDVLARSVSNKALAYEELYEGATSQRVNPWLYSISKWASTITIPSGSVSSEYLFYNSNGSFWDSGMSYRSTGPNGGITERLWAYNLPFAISGSIPPASGGWSGVGSANSYVKAEFSTLPDANGNISSTSPTAIKEFKFDKNGNVLEVLEYDWVTYGSVPRSGTGIYAKVTGLPTSGLTLKRKTVNTYYNQAADADSASVNGNEYMNPSSPSLKNLIRSTEVRDGSGVVKARSEFYYDSITTTGNLTETRVWDSTKGAVSDPLTTGTSGNAVSTQSTYDSYGNPTTVTDAKAIVSKIIYGEVLGPNGNVTGLYPTETIVADGTSLARTSTASYDLYTGAVLTTTDEDNDITNATEYDDLGRPIQAITALGKTLESWTITEYHDDERFVVVKSDLEAKGDGKKVATQFYDQLGRVRLTKTLEDASTQSATN
jgi:YD repeat-containing protein